MPHNLKFPNFWEKAPWNKASTGVLRFLKFKNRQNWLCRRKSQFSETKMLPESFLLVPQHCNPYPKTQCRFWKNNKRTSEHSPRLLGHTEPWHLAEWGNDRLNWPGWQTFNRWKKKEILKAKTAEKASKIVGIGPILKNSIKHFEKQTGNFEEAKTGSSKGIFTILPKLW